MFVTKAAVVGAETMGGEIAQVISSAGIPVVLKDIDQKFVDQGLTKAEEVSKIQTGSQVKKEKITQDQADQQVAEILGRITGTTSYDELGDVDFVVEAVPERMDIKQQVFADLDASTPGHAILSSNTSGLSITEMGDATLRPEKVVGFHFFWPASMMRLIEVIEGEATSEDTLQTATNFAQAIRKTPVRCGEVPGFVVNRILMSGAAEIWRAQQESGKSPQEVDQRIQESKALPMGPFFLADMTGLDTTLHVAKNMVDSYGDRFYIHPPMKELVAGGNFGQKTGKGFYEHPSPDAEQKETILLDWRDEGRIAIVWLNRPPMNPLSPTVIAELAETWKQIDGKARAMIIASSNTFTFAAGADIKEFTKMDESTGAKMVEQAHSFMRSMEQSRTVTIAAVNSIALGGGCEVAMACDFRIAAESASFGQPEINLGIIPGFGGTQRLPRLVGEAKALEMNLIGEPIDAWKALEIGLANEVVPDHELFDTTLQWARKLAGQAPIAIEQIKKVSAHGDLDKGLEHEAHGFAKAVQSEDAQEVIGDLLGR